MTEVELPVLPRFVAPALLVAALVLLGLAPLALPGDYRWVEHGLSEAGAQGVDGAWVARSGFLSYGLGVLAVVLQRSRTWSLAGVVLHGAFAVSMLAVAAFSARSWDPAVPHVASEDALHSLFASAMGFAFVVGVVSVAVTRARRTVVTVAVDVVAVVAATLAPLLVMDTGSWGLTQRGMFAVAALWFSREALAADPSGGRAPPSSAVPVDE